jgi:hypothetical protein
MNLKRTLIKAHWLLSEQFGISPLKTVQSIRGLPRYLRGLTRFRSAYSGNLNLTPCLHDWYEAGGDTTSEYFWQDLLVAKRVCAANPRRHVDIGSRVDGFVAHVASFREIEVFDIRQIAACIPGVTFKQADLMRPVASLARADGYCDSLSCLHALEHFGLGRYGDEIDPQGFEHGIVNMAALLETDGIMYLSVPIGQERVEFNANRVFDPRTIIRQGELRALRLIELIVIGAGGNVVTHSPVGESDIAKLASCYYSLGVFIFKKTGIFSRVADA